MKTSRPVQLAILLIGALVTSGETHASNILQTVTEGTGSDWTAASWGSGPSVAASGNPYECPSSSFTVRTPNKNLAGLYSTNFAGSSLQIDAGGFLYLKHSGNATNAAVVNLLLNGGSMTYHGGFAPVPAPVGGTLQVLAASTISSDQNGGSGSPGADIWLLSPVSGSGNLSVNMDTKTNALILFGTNNTYIGNWTNVTGIIELASGSSHALGSGSVTLNFSSSTFLEFNATNNMTVNNSIYGIGNVIKTNTNTVTLAGNNAYTGMTTISGGVLQIGAGTALTNSFAIALLGGTLDASLVGGLNLGAAGQQMTNCNGTINGGLSAASTNVLNFNVIAATNDILNVTGGSLTLNGNPGLNLTIAGYKPTGTYRLINYTGSVQGGGSFNLTGTNSSSETFALDTSTPGQVNLVVVGATYNITWIGDGSANSWDLSTANWTGGTNLYTDGDNVAFNDSGSATPDIAVAALVHPGSMVVSNDANQYIFDGAGIVSSGSLVKAGTAELDFTSTNNNFSGPVTIQDGTLSIGVGGATGSLGAPTSITNNGTLKVNLSTGGVGFRCPISGSGALFITGGGTTVTAGATNTYTGLTTIDSGCQLNISSTSALGSTSAGTMVLSGGRLGVASLVGSMTVAEPITVSGPGVGGAPGALYCNTPGNTLTFSGPITIASDVRFRVVNAGVTMNFSNTVLGTNVNLECTAGNGSGDTATTITFQNTLSLGTGTLTVDNYGVVVLGGNTTCGSTVVTADNSASSLLSAGPVTLLVNGTLDGGAVSVASTTTLGGSGTIQGPVNVDGTLVPGTSSTIATLTVNNTVTLNSDATTAVQLNRTNAQNASLVAAASTSLGGTLTVANVGTALQAGDAFHLFSGTLSGAFAATNLPDLSYNTNLYWDVSDLNSSGIIKVASLSIAATNPVIANVTFGGGNLAMQVVSQDGSLNYVLQATPQLAPPGWSNVQTNSGAGGSVLNFSVAVSPSTPNQFFRVVVQ